MQMNRNADDTWPPDAPPGTFDIGTNGVEGYPRATGHIIFVCPRGKRCAVLVGPEFVERPNPDALCIWKWDGNMEHPTLSPSINCIAEKDGNPTGGCGWHGFITNGDMQ